MPMTSRKNPTGRRLWQDQVEAIQLCSTFLSERPERKSALITMPTGSGKTAVIAAIAAEAADDAVALVVSPFDALCDQLMADIGGRTWADVDIGEYGPAPKTVRLMPSDTPKRFERHDGERLVVVST